MGLGSHAVPEIQRCESPDYGDDESAQQVLGTGHPGEERPQYIVSVGHF